MITVILGILKVIGLILLVILGLIVLLLMLVLLVPVRYEAKGSFLEKRLKGRAGVSWLLHGLSVKAVYDGELDLVIRILGIRIGGRAKEDAEAEAEKREEAEPLIPEPPITEPPAASQPEVQEPLGHQESSEAVHVPKTESRTEQESGARVRPVRRICAKLKEKIRAVREKIRGLRQKLLKLKEKKEKLQGFLQNEDNKKTLALVKRQIFRLIRHILPRRMKGWFRFGFDDPYTTGQVLMYLSPFYGLYADKVQLIPVFEESVLEGELQLKGRIRIGTVLVTAARLLFDRNFRKLLKKLWKA